MLKSSEQNRRVRVCRSARRLATAADHPCAVSPAVLVTPTVFAPLTETGFATVSITGGSSVRSPLPLASTYKLGRVVWPSVSSTTMILLFLALPSAHRSVFRRKLVTGFFHQSSGLVRAQGKFLRHDCVRSTGNSRFQISDRYKLRLCLCHRRQPQPDNRA